MIRVAHWSRRSPWRALGLWLAVVVVLGANALSVESQLGPPSIRTDGSESQKADDAAARTFGHTASLPILLTGPPRAVRHQARVLTRALGAGGHRHVLSPVDRGLPADIRRLLRPDARTLALVAVAPTSQAIDGEAGDAVKAIVARQVHPPVRAAVTGYSVVGGAFADESLKAVRNSEKIAIPVLLLILLFVFRSPVAASLPLILGVGSTLSGLGLIGYSHHVADVADIALSVCSLLSLALGVDYSLLLLSRFREEMRHGRSPEEATIAAVDSAGRTVTFAAVAILVVMAGLVVSAPGSNAVSAGAGPICAALAALFGALVAMPALLSLLGERVDRWRIGPPQRDDGGRWGALARWAHGHPWRAILPAAALVLVIAPSGLGLDTGPPDPRTLPGTSTVRHDAETVARALGPGLLSPFIVDVSAPAGLTPSRREAFARELRRDPGVLAVLGPPAADGSSAARLALTRSGRTSRYLVFPRTPPNAPQTSELTDRLRRLARRDEARAPGRTVLVGGVAAELTDAGRDISAGFAPMVLVITLLTAVAMFVVLRAFLLPLVCVAINLVTVLVSLGAVALLCTGSDPLFGGPGFADNTALLGVFAIVFALSLDYQVFVLERIREEWERSGSVEAAVTGAIDQTARVITGAAAILVAVFATFAIPDLQTLRQSGVGLTTAVIVDATLVRLVLLPAAITLVGPRSFWLPAWVDRALPALRSG